ncbi:unnamed protein product [Diamesa serratosioi]
MRPCEIEAPVILKFFFNNTSGIPDVLLISGYIIVKELVEGPLDLFIDSRKCDLSMQTCEKYRETKMDKMCEKLQNFKHPVFGDLLVNIVPKIGCPMLPGNYTINPSVSDMRHFQSLPIEKKVLLITFSLFTGTPGVDRKTVMCFESETSIYKTFTKT